MTPRPDRGWLEPSQAGVVRVGSGLGRRRSSQGVDLHRRAADRRAGVGVGVANQLAPKAEVIDTARSLAVTIAERAPIAVQMAKQAIDAGDA